jgi:predicted acylesterase/phospholipase RssA
MIRKRNEETNMIRENSKPSDFLTHECQEQPIPLGKRFRDTTLLFVLSSLMAGCLTAPVFTVKNIPDQPTCTTESQNRENLVGLAVSGGGSRAALFAAGAYEALGKVRVGPEQQSLLNQVSHVSSVSGGSLASAYYILKKPKKDIPILNPSGEFTPEYQEFFNGFKETVARDYEDPLLGRQIFSLRWFNPAWTAQSLAEILGEEYIGTTTFGELSVREKEGDSPHFLVNTTLYNDGRRLVLSTLDREALRYDFIEDLQRRQESQTLEPRSQRVLKVRWEALQSQTPEDLRFDICRVKVAGAVAASMSFPPIIGPISFHLEGEDQYWHAGDGGLSDNTGAESLLMVFLKELQEERARRALLILFDSSFPFSVGGSKLNHRAEAFSLFSYDFSRIPSIMEERSIAYRAMFLGVAQQYGLLPDPSRIRIIKLQHTDAKWEEDLSDLPETCSKEEMGWESPDDVAQHLAGIVTRLWLKSDCDQDLILTSAAKVVAQNEANIRKFLEQ